MTDGYWRPPKSFWKEVKMKTEMQETHQWQYLYVHKYEPIALIHGKTIHGGEFVADEIQTNWNGITWEGKNLLEDIKDNYVLIGEL